jgi:hypothetical protein
MRSPDHHFIITGRRPPVVVTTNRPNLGFQSDFVAALEFDDPIRAEQQAASQPEKTNDFPEHPHGFVDGTN